MKNEDKTFEDVKLYALPEISQFLQILQSPSWITSNYNLHSRIKEIESLPIFKNILWSDVTASRNMMDGAEKCTKK